MGRYERLEGRLAGLKGAYLLFFELAEEFRGKIGILGEVFLRPGLYVYIGSGLGRGGVWSRVKRHLTSVKERKYWHIDYLTSQTTYKPIAVVVIESSEPLEEEIVKILLEAKEFSIAYPRFGSTDKKSPSHLLVLNYHRGSIGELLTKTVILLREKLGKPVFMLRI